MKNIDIETLILDYQNLDFNKLLESNLFNKLEKESFDKYKIENVKKERIISLYLKKKYIGNYYLDSNNKPKSKDIYFNISHSNGRIILSKTNYSEIGVDIEKIRDINPKLIDYISNDEELKYIKDNKSFFEIWTSKESLLKASGLGIKIDLKEVKGLPINGTRKFNDSFYYSSIFYIDDFVISTTLKGNKKFNVEYKFIDLN